MSTAVAKKEERFKDLRTFLTRDSVRSNLEMALPKHLTPDRLIRIALSAASRQPLLLECTPESVCLSLIRAAEFGVETDGWDAHLVPYKNKGKLECQLVVDYKGLVKLAYQSELVISIDAAAVYEKDDFEYSRGLDPYLRHRPTDEALAGSLKYAWACAKIKGGGAPFVVLNKREVMEHKSKSQASDYSPWNNPATEAAMWVKTAIRVLAKFLPRSATLKEALKHEDALDRGGRVVDGIVFDNEAPANTSGAEPRKGSRSDELADRIGGPEEAACPNVDESPDETDEQRIVREYAECNSLKEVEDTYDDHCGPNGWALSAELSGLSRELRVQRREEIKPSKK